MRRIIIVGSAGCGKSTLARQLGKRLGLPVIHLDALCWQPGWKAISTDELRAELSQAIEGDAWITDGNYAVHTFDLRLPRADLVIWVERSTFHCVWRVIRRAIRSRFDPQQDLAPGCKERIDRRFFDRLRFIVRFNRVNRPRIEAARMMYGPQVPVLVLRGDKAMRAFLASCESEGPQPPAHIARDQCT